MPSKLHSSGTRSALNYVRLRWERLLFDWGPSNRDWQKAADYIGEAKNVFCSPKLTPWLRSSNSATKA